MASNATLRRDGDALRFEQPGATRKLCAPTLMEQEQRFLEALGQVQRWDVSGIGQLRLWPAEGKPIRLWPEEEAFEAAQQERRAAGLEPEAIPAELYNWRERAEEEVQQLVEVAARQRRYEAEAQWKWKWQDFDEKWEAYVKNRIKPSRLEPIFQEEIELRRNSHREPPSIIELPDWMKIEEVLDIHERNLKIEEIRRKLGLHPGDETGMGIGRRAGPAFVIRGELRKGPRTSCRAPRCRIHQAGSTRTRKPHRR